MKTRKLRANGEKTQQNNKSEETSENRSAEQETSPGDDKSEVEGTKNNEDASKSGDESGDESKSESITITSTASAVNDQQRHDHKQIEARAENYAKQAKSVIRHDVFRINKFPTDLDMNSDGCKSMIRNKVIGKYPLPEEIAVFDDNAWSKIIRIYSQVIRDRRRTVVAGMETKFVGKIRLSLVEPQLNKDLTYVLPCPLLLLQNMSTREGI